MMASSGSRQAIPVALVLLISVLTPQTLSSSTLEPHPDQCPDRCRCQGDEPAVGNLTFSVTVVNCSGVDLSRFPNNIPITVTLLDLSLNRIDTLPTPGSLEYLKHLKTLILSGNSVVGPVGPRAFLGLRSLKTIDLSYNGITSLHNETFHGCDQLQSVDLTGNRGLEKIPYFNSSSIKTMTLDHCSVAEPSTAKPLLPASLTELNLRGNPLEEIPSMIGKNLHTLDLTSCALSVVQRESLQGLPFLTRLFVSKNARLTSLTHVRSESLRIIDAEDCSLGSVEGKGKKKPSAPLAPLASMSGLTHAHLAGNRIKSLGANAFSSSKHLVHIDLSRNGLEHVSARSLTGLTNLQMVNLSFNAIKSLDESTFSASHVLQVLDVSHNGVLTHLPAFEAVYLRALLASRCEISGFGIRGEGNPLEHMPNLEVLDLSRNPLEVLPKVLSSQGLKRLDLSFCRITVVESQILKGLSHLVWLDLRGNRIATLDPDAVRGLKYLALSDNPWKCDCGNPSFQELWRLLDKMDPKGQDLHCAPDKERMLASPSDVVPPGEGLDLWQDICPRSTSPGVPVPASSMWSLSVAMVLAVAAFLVGGVVFRHWMKERRKARQEAEEAVESVRRRRVGGRRRRGGRRENSSEDEDENEEARQPSRDVVVVRRLRVETLPPSYEEAVLMPRPEEVEVRLEVAEPETAGAAERTTAEEGAANEAEAEDRGEDETTRLSATPREGDTPQDNPPNGIV